MYKFNIISKIPANVFMELDPWIIKLIFFFKSCKNSQDISEKENL